MSTESNANTIESVSDFQQKLLTAKSVNEVESTLNAFTVPTNTLSQKEALALKAVLQSIVDSKDNITNKIIRRRITRMIFAISTSEEKQVIKSTPKVVKPQPVKKNNISKGLKIESTTPKIVLKPVNECIATLSGANVNNFETILQDITPETVEGRNRDQLLNALRTLLDNAEVITNAKSRRRVSRLIQTFETAPLPAEESAAVDAETQIATAVEVKKSIEECVLEINNATVDNLEAILQNISTDNVEAGDRDALIEALRSLSQNKEIVANAKTRRRVSRMIQLFEGETRASSSICASEANNTTQPKAIGQAKAAAIVAGAAEVADSSEVSLSDCIKLIKSAKTSEELDDALTKIPWSVDPSSDTSVRELLTGARSTLSELQSSSEAIVANAKVRRRIKRVIDMIDSKLHEPGAAKEKREEKYVSSSEATSADNLSKKRKTEKPTDDDSGNEREDKNVPRVVFIGQLAFNTTAQDIEQFLRENNITGKISVRMLTDSKTKESRGAAFVEFENLFDTNRCIELHHSKLNGRRINVERTCGGRNSDVRAMKIKHIRNEQKIALSEAVDVIVKDYEARGILSMRDINDQLMNRLYALTPELVTEIMEDFRKFKARFSQTPVTLGVLHRLVNARDGGGATVDQSKGQKFGSKFDQPKRLRTEGEKDGSEQRREKRYKS